MYNSTLISTVTNIIGKRLVLHGFFTGVGKEEAIFAALKTWRATFI